MTDVVFAVGDGQEAVYYRKEKESDTISEHVTNVPYVALDAEHAPATTITMDSITLAAADTEYSKAVPANCKALEFRVVAADKLTPGADIRYAFATGKVAALTLPFQILDGGAVYSKESLNLTSKTIYFAGGADAVGHIVLLEMWS